MKLILSLFCFPLDGNKNEALKFFSDILGLGYCQDKIDNIDFVECHSHLTGEDWWRQIRRFQEPIAAPLCNLSITLPQPIAFSAAGLKPHPLST